MSSLTRRDLGGRLSAAMAVASVWPSVGRAAVVGGAPYVDPELRAALDAIRRPPGPPLSGASLPDFRRMGSTWAQKPLDHPAVVERMLPPVRGDAPVRVYVIGAQGGAVRRPAILHIHGGGFVAGTALGNVADLQRLSSRLDCLIVSVEYRLAPETPFPGALEDNYAALMWLHQNADALGVDPSRIAVMGESAGGGHAAMLAIAARDRSEAPICFQVLLCPMLDDRTGSVAGTTPGDSVYTWTSDQNRFGWSALLGVAPGSPTVPAGSVPARVKDLRGLPPAFIGVGTADLFADEDIGFAKGLMDAGTPVQFVLAPGGYHGFDSIAPTARLSKWFTRSWTDALARAFGEAGEPG